MSDEATIPPPPPPGQGVRQFPCCKCGAMLVFDPGATALRCVYCGTTNTIERDADRQVEELELRAHLRNLRDNAEITEALLVRCEGCGAEQTFGPNITAGECAFCGKAIVAQGRSRRLIKPQSLLPFRITKQQSVELYVQWIRSRWFAPSALKRKAEKQRIYGSYIPAWTYDSNTTTPYRGQRGEHYWETQTYTTVENGKTVTRTRQVRKTRWYPASGTIRYYFDDVLVLATTSLPKGYGEELEPWDLSNLCPFDERYLSGFTAEAYDIDLPQGWQTAQSIMENRVRGMIRIDIGGDEQRIDWYQVHHAAMTFKHILLPVWISAYTYHGKTFQFLVNGRTGEVQGQRPYSWIKITLFVMTIAAIVGTAAMVLSRM